MNYDLFMFYFYVFLKMCDCDCCVAKIINNYRPNKKKYGKNAHVGIVHVCHHVHSEGGITKQTQAIQHMHM